MWIHQHVILSILPTLILFYFGYYIFGILFCLASILIDIDHGISMAILDKTANLFKIVNILKEIHFNDLKDYEEKLFCVFHTFEFLFLLAVLSFYYSLLIPILWGLIFHVVVDILTVGWKKNKRIFFTTFFILKYARGEYGKLSEVKQ